MLALAAASAVVDGGCSFTTTRCQPQEEARIRAGMGSSAGSGFVLGLFVGVVGVVGGGAAGFGLEKATRDGPCIDFCGVGGLLYGGLVGGVAGIIGGAVLGVKSGRASEHEASLRRLRGENPDFCSGGPVPVETPPTGPTGRPELVERCEPLLARWRAEHDLSRRTALYNELPRECQELVIRAP